MEKHVAVFEKPLPIQADFMLQRLSELAEHDPSLRFERDYRWLDGAIRKHYTGDDSDIKRMAAGLLKAYVGSTVEQYEQRASSYLHTARHPLLERPYLRCVYRPMIELLRYLESAQFTNYIVSGGARDFVRTISQEVYGVPPERVIGSTVTLSFRDQGETVTVCTKLRSASSTMGRKARADFERDWSCIFSDA